MKSKINIEDIENYCNWFIINDWKHESYKDVDDMKSLLYDFERNQETFEIHGIEKTFIRVDIIYWNEINKKTGAVTTTSVVYNLFATDGAMTIAQAGSDQISFEKINMVLKLIDLL